MKQRLWLHSLLAIATMAVYWQVTGHDFINFDDPGYVYENPHVMTGLSLDNIQWALTAIHMSNWHPLTWLSHMVDCQLFGLNPGWHHVVNLLFHVGNTLLLFALLDRMTGAVWRSAFVAALFALHPLHVESVAWVAERKDVLSTFFWLLCTHAYLRYAASPGWRRYVPVIVSFVFALMAKPMAVTLPFTLLLLDYWPLCRLHAGPAGARDGQPASPRAATLGRLLWEKTPLFALSAVSSILTVHAQQSTGVVLTLEAVPFIPRLNNALVAWLGYITKAIWPSRLSVLYPLELNLPEWKVAASLLVLVGVSFLVCRAARRHRYLATGWFWYVGTLVPVIGIVQVGIQSMADRYTYVPLIGLFIMVAWGVPELFGTWRHRRVVMSVSGTVILLAFALCTRLRVDDWKDTLTLFSQSVRVTSNNYVAHNLLGIAYAREGKIGDALDQFALAIKIDPNYADAYYDMGNALKAAGRVDEAIASYQAAIRINPNYAEAYNNLGTTLFNRGRVEEAAAHFEEALRIKPDYYDARENLETCLRYLGKR